MKVTKKNGTVMLFDDEKVATSILKANADANEQGLSPAMAANFANEVFNRLTGDHEIITTADVKEYVFALLQEKGFSGTAKCYMEYVK